MVPLPPREVLEAAVRDFAAARRAPSYDLKLLPVNTRPDSLQFREDAPADLRDLASVAGGINVDHEDVTWDPPSVGQAMPGAIDDPWAIHVDGLGNAEAIDVAPDGRWGSAVYFICHDPPHLVLMAPDLATWLQDFLDRHLGPTPLARALHARAPDDGLAADGYLDAFGAGRRDCRGADRTLGAAGGIVTDDPVLRSFCSALAPESVVLDFRGARSGDHADLDPFNRASTFSRAGSLPLFAVLPDPVHPGRPTAR